MPGCQCFACCLPRAIKNIFCPPVPALPPWEDEYSVFFDGVNQYVNCGDCADFERTDPFSVDAWIKTSETGYQIIMSRMDIALNRGWQFYILGGAIGFMLMNSVAVNQISITTVAATFDDGAWYHVVVTYDGSSSAGGFNIYVDNNDEALNIIADTLSATSQTAVNCEIASHTSGTNPFNGNLDEVAIWNKELSSGEVSAIYNAGTPDDLATLPTWANCLHWWRMGDGDTWPTLTDNKGSNNGNMINMAPANIVNDVP